jgi:hypothetical protein
MTGIISLTLALFFALAGACIGWLHFRSLRPIAALIIGGDRRALGFQLLRLAGMAGFLVLAAQGGALVLLAAAGGVFVGRWQVLRAARQEAG